VTLAYRAKTWLAVAGFGAVALVMSVIAVFGLPI
jgi:hypothetical protein